MTFLFFLLGGVDFPSDRLEDSSNVELHNAPHTYLLIPKYKPRSSDAAGDLCVLRDRHLTGDLQTIYPHRIRFSTEATNTLHLHGTNIDSNKTFLGRSYQLYTLSQTTPFGGSSCWLAGSSLLVSQPAMTILSASFWQASVKHFNTRPDFILFYKNIAVPPKSP